MNKEELEQGFKDLLEPLHKQQIILTEQMLAGINKSFELGIGIGRVTTIEDLRSKHLISDITAEQLLN